MRNFVWWKCRVSVFGTSECSFFVVNDSAHSEAVYECDRKWRTAAAAAAAAVCPVSVYSLQSDALPINTSLSGSTAFFFFLMRWTCSKQTPSMQRVLSWSRWTLSKKYVFNSRPDTLMITYARRSLSTLFNHCRAKCGKRPKSQRKCPGFGERDEYWEGGGLHFLHRVTSGLFSLLITTMNILPLLSHPSIKPGEEGGGRWRETVRTHLT